MKCICVAKETGISDCICKILLNYGLTQYEARYADEPQEDFLLWQGYRQDQVLLKILENPKHNQYGTYYKMAICMSLLV